VAGSIQSFRIAYAEGAGKTVTYVIPDGKRVSVKYVTAQNESSVDAFVYVGVHGIYAFRLYLPATATAQRAELMMVGYERETVALITTGSNTHAMLSGFIFDDPLGNPARDTDLPGASPLPTRPPGA
jgi:hypothetical protein